ncbi:O-antigen ligase family protein [Paenibacillus silviterrae]|uniref:O-antigen ligase family protein n=1 Tax=Paenibacillus silviterrae TaxID=3242194 RepID=UPI002542F8E2|nr:O-antigen ligase family protein [Paenibacillus chinjuensis]
MANKYKVNKNSKLESNGIIYWTLIIMVFCFLMITPFYRGLFNGNSPVFDGPLFGSFVFGAIILGILSFHILINKEAFSNKAFYGVVIFVIPLSYLVSFLGSPASYHSAQVAIFISLLYTSFFLIGLFLTNKLRYSNVLVLILMAVFYMIVLFGLINWFGYINYRDAVLNQRLTSVFQYPNTYAALLMGVLFAASFLITINNNILSKFVNALMLVPIFISFFLTFSRGAMIFIPLLLIFFLFFISVRNQLQFIFNLLISGICSLSILNMMTRYQAELVQGTTNNQLLITLITLSLLSLVSAFIIIFIDKQLIKINTEKFEKKSFRFLIPGFLILILIITLASFDYIKGLLPGKLQERIGNISLEQSSAYSRNTFYVDSWSIFKEHPLFGSGGGAWSALYEKFQSYPYVSRQAHSFYMQYLNEVGLFGLLFFITITVMILVGFVRFSLKNEDKNVKSSFIFFIIAISLLAHSTLDFNMSFIFIGIILFLCLGCLASVSSGFAIQFKWDQNNFYRYSYVGFSLIVFFIMMVYSVGFLKAHNYYSKAVINLETTKDYNIVSTNLNKALEIMPYHTHYNLLKIDLLNQLYNQTKSVDWNNQISDTLNVIMPKEKYNPLLIEREYFNLYNQGDLERALEVAYKGLNNSSWNLAFYEKMISIHGLLWDTARLKNDNRSMDDHFNKITELYNQIGLKQKQLTNLPKGVELDKAFYISPNIAFEVGKVYYARGEFAQAVNIFYQGVSEKMDLPIHRYTTRWYLATLIKLQQTNQILYDKLLAKYPEEKAEIEKLVNMNF